MDGAIGGGDETTGVPPNPAPAAGLITDIWPDIATDAFEITNTNAVETVLSVFIITTLQIKTKGQN
jgi:hypothetical protein